MPSHHEAVPERTRHRPARFDDLDRLIEAEIEALTREQPKETSQPPPEASAPAREPGLSPIELRFLDRAADWLSRRSDPGRLIDLLRERVLGAQSEDEMAAVFDPEDEQASAEQTPDTTSGESVRPDDSPE
jgi:hypothetical protein